MEASFGLWTNFFFRKFYRVAPQKIDLFDFSDSRIVFSIKKSSEKNKKSRGHNAKKIWAFMILSIFELNSNDKWRKFPNAAVHASWSFQFSSIWINFTFGWTESPNITQWVFILLCNDTIQINLVANWYHLTP